MRILLLGKNGQVGWELQSTLAPLGEIIALGRSELDLANPASIRSLVRQVRPELIVNAAAYTGVDQAEGEPEMAMAVNGIAPGVLAEEAKPLGAGLVHYSTDYVFDGTKREPYTEGDPPNPLNVYGRTKLAGDEAIEAIGGACLILRTGWVYGLRRRNFLTAIRQQAEERQPILVVDDQVGSPTWCRSIAEVTAAILGSIHQGGAPAFRARLSDLWGTYHYSAAGETSRFAFAKAILETDPARTDNLSRDVRPISSDQYPSPAKRPAYSVLSKRNIRLAFGVGVQPWQEQLDACWQTLAEERQ